MMMLSLLSNRNLWGRRIFESLDFGDLCNRGKVFIFWGFPRIIDIGG